MHADLSAFNVLVHEGEAWFIDLAGAIRVDRLGGAPWRRLAEAGVALERGLRALQTYFRRHGLTIDVEAVRDEVLGGLK